MEAPALRPDLGAPKSSPIAGDIASRPPTSEKTTMAFALLQALMREWGKPAQIEGQAPWGWSHWLALALVGSTVLGLGRLATGLWAIRRLRSNSHPVADRTLIDTVEILRAEMSCSAPVEIRT